MPRRGRVAPRGLPLARRQGQRQQHPAPPRHPAAHEAPPPQQQPPAAGWLAARLGCCCRRCRALHPRRRHPHLPRPPAGAGAGAGAEGSWDWPPPRAQQLPHCLLPLRRFFFFFRFVRRWLSRFPAQCRPAAAVGAGVAAALQPPPLWPACCRCLARLPPSCRPGAHRWRAPCNRSDTQPSNSNTACSSQTGTTCSICTRWRQGGDRADWQPADAGPQSR